MMELLQEIAQVCLVPLFTVLTGYFIKWVNVKKEELKLATDDANKKGIIDLVGNVVTECVLATNQTYVKSLKKENIFTKEAQQEAFKLTYDAIGKILSQEAQEYIIATYGDYEAYITNKIEAEINAHK